MTFLIIFLLILCALLAAFSATLAHLLMKERKLTKWLPPLYEIDVSIDCFFTLKEKEYIIESLMQWQEATHGMVMFHIVNTDAKKLVHNDGYGYAINFIRALAEDEEVKEWDIKHKRTILGYAQGYEPCGLAFIVADRMYGEKEVFTATCGHEVGHLLGLPHNPEKNTLMYKYINKLKPTHQDVRELVYLWRDWINS